VTAVPVIRRFVLIGAGVAGGTAALTLRKEGVEGEVVLIGAEPHLPYDRPPLSKEFLRGEAPFERALLQPPERYEEVSIECRLGERVRVIHPQDHAVELDGGERIRYDRLLLATGARNRRPRLPGIDLPGVHDVRTVEDARAVMDEMAPGRRAAIVGMGFVGSEVAASLRSCGLEVSLIAGRGVPLARVLGRRIGEVLAAIHREHGVRLVGGRAVGFEGDQMVRRVLVEGADPVDCDFAVTGLGVEPSVELATTAGLEVEDGIVVDERCRTSAPDVFAAGDVADYFHPLVGRRMRVEHWRHAIRHGQAAALSMLDRATPYDDIPWFWSDQYEHNIQFTGFETEWEHMVVRGDLEERRFVAYSLSDGVVQAAVAFNQGRDLRRSTSLIASRTPVDRGSLMDQTVDLRALARSALR